jgi:hypothetical protein
MFFCYRHDFDPQTYVRNVLPKTYDSKPIALKPIVMKHIALKNIASKVQNLSLSNRFIIHGFNICRLLSYCFKTYRVQNLSA